MTIQVPLTTDEEHRIIKLAKEQGVSPAVFVQSAAKHMLSVSLSGHADSEDRDLALQELFASFDTVDTGEKVNEAAFHRESWY